MSLILAVGENQFEWLGVRVDTGGTFVDFAVILHHIFWKVYDQHRLKMILELIADHKDGWQRITTEFPAVSVEQRRELRQVWAKNPSKRNPDPSTYYTSSGRVYAQGEQFLTWYEDVTRLVLIDDKTGMVSMYWIEPGCHLEYFGCFDLNGPEFYAIGVEGEI